MSGDEHMEGDDDDVDIRSDSDEEDPDTQNKREIRRLTRVMKRRFDRMERRFNRMERRFNHLEQQQDRTRREVRALTAVFLDEGKQRRQHYDDALEADTDEDDQAEGDDGEDQAESDEGEGQGAAEGERNGVFRDTVSRARLAVPGWLREHLEEGADVYLTHHGSRGNCCPAALAAALPDVYAGTRQLKTAVRNYATGHWEALGFHESAEAATQWFLALDAIVDEIFLHIFAEMVQCRVTVYSNDPKLEAVNEFNAEAAIDDQHPHIELVNVVFPDRRATFYRLNRR